MGHLPSVKDSTPSDTTTSTTWEDVDGATVDLTVDDQSDILLIATIQATGSVSAEGGWRLVFDGTNYLQSLRQVDSEPGNITLVDLVPNKLAGTYTFKLQHKIASGTLTTGVMLVAVSLHNGNGAVPAKSVYVASDTVGNAWEDIPGLTTDITLSKTSHIWAMMVFHGYHSGANKRGSFAINIDATRMEVADRDWGGANQHGALAVVTRTDTEKTAGTYTVKGEWIGQGGTTLTGEDFSLVVIAAEADSGNAAIDIQKDIVSSDTTTATALEDITGLSVTNALDEASHVLSVITLSTDVSVNGASAFCTIQIDGTDYGVMERGHAAQQRKGSIGHVVRTTTEISSGDRILNGRWYTDSGNTLTGTGICLTSIVLDALTPSDSAELSFNLTVQNPSSDEVSANFQVQAVTPGSVQLSANVTVQQPDSQQLSANATVQNVDSDQLSGNFTTQKSSSVQVSANCTIQQSSSSELSANFVLPEADSSQVSANLTVQNSALGQLSSNFTAQQSASAEISSNLQATQAGLEQLGANLTVQQSASTQLSSNITVQQGDSEEVSASFTIQRSASVELSSNFTVQRSAFVEVSANATIQNAASDELSSNFTLQKSASKESSANFTIQKSDSAQLSANATIQKAAFDQLSSNFTVQQLASEQLSSNFTIQRSASIEVSANFTVAQDFAELSAVFQLGLTGFAQLSSNLTVLNADSAEVSANFQIQRSASDEISANFAAQKPAFVQLSSNAVIQKSASGEVSASFTIQKSAFSEISATITVQSAASDELSSNFTAAGVDFEQLSSSLTVARVDSAEVSANAFVFQTGSEELSATFITAPSFAELSATFSVVKGKVEPVFVLEIAADIVIEVQTGEVYSV